MATRARIRLGVSAMACVVIAHALVPPALTAQQGGAPAPAAAAQETTPPLLLREQWKQVDAAVAVPTSPRRSNGKYWLASQLAVTNPNAELRLYGTDARNVTVYQHENRYDLWTGLVGSPVAVLLKHKGSFLDLTGLARVRATVRTGNLHTLHPVVRMADGTLVAGSQSISTDGQFLQVEVAFDNQRWFVLEPDTLAVKGAAMKVDLARVDEVGFVDLAPAGGHGNSGWVNISWFEIYAKPVAR